MFQTGQVMPELPKIVAAAHAAGARVLLDIYHSLGVFPVDLEALDVDFAVGGSYKYLRGGPGACFLYRRTPPSRCRDRERSTSAGSRRSRRSPMRARIRRATPPAVTRGSNRRPPCCRSTRRAPGRSSRRRSAWRGCARIRSKCSSGSWRFSPSAESPRCGGTADRGAFVVVRTRSAPAWADALAARGIVTDARGEYLRLCPDVLTTEMELGTAAGALAEIPRNRGEAP